MQQQPIIQAWLFPGPPACSASTEIADGRTINVLKPQYYRLADNGTLIELNVTDPSVGCNGFSPANAAAIKAHSAQQFVTISGTIVGIQALANSAALTSTAIKQVVAFLTMTQFSGIELDIEGFSSWTMQQYSAYKSIITTLGNALHNAGFQLMLDGPAITGTQYQGYYSWKYEDFNSLPVDALVVMCYDFQYDHGAGAPVASLQNITDCCTWMKSKITDPTRVVIGLNSYGYHGKTGSYTIMNDTYQQSMLYPGFATAIRDSSSGEMMWAGGGISYDYSDTTTLNGKVQAVLSTGLSTVSIWHLGGNQWLSPPPVAQPQVQTDPALTAFNTAYPGFAQWYKNHFDANGNFTA